MGRVDGAAPLLGVSAVCGARVAAGGGVARAVVGAGGVAVRGVQVRGTGSVVGVAPVGAVSAVAPDREQHAVFDIAGGRGDSELGVAGAGAEPAASEWGLGGGARAWVGVGGDVCGPGAISRRGVRRLELGAGGADEGICAAQRGVYGRAQGAEGDVRSGTEAWGAGGGWRTRRTARSGTVGGRRCVTRGRSCGRCGSCLHRCRIAACGQGRKHRLATVLAICALARLSGLSGPAATERFARHLSQEELRALGAWRDPKAGRWVAPSDSTLCRVVADTDPDALQDVLSQWAAPRAGATGPQPALAADGKRIRGANRHTDEGVYFETVTLVTHAGRPLASRCCRDKGGEIAAARALLEDVDVQGCVITLDALHTTRDNRTGHRRNPRRRLPVHGQGQLPRHPHDAGHLRLEHPACPSLHR